ncbi:MAG TPA: cytochrome c, partial [Steroidobacteraceae bacterium]|nr:cytochrome c [Steroidobacteraceae bacterium]
MRALLPNLRGGAFLALVTLQLLSAAAVADPKTAAGDSFFEKTCAACHGSGGVGGDRAPRLANNAHLRSLSDAQIKAIIANGTPGGMPAFALPDATLT